MKNVLLIINPKSGRGMIAKYMLDILNIFSSRGIMATTYITQCKSDAYRKAKHESGNYDMVVCSGGDGTLDEVVAGVLKSGYMPLIGYIPAGSTNDFAHSLQLPSDMKQAAEIIVEERPFRCDIGCFDDLYFVYVAAFGVFTEVSYKTNQDMKNLLGHVAYILEGARSLLDIKPYKMKCVIDDDMVIEGEFIYGMMANSESVGGIDNIAGNDVELDDGYFELVLIRKPKGPLDFQAIISGLVSKQTDNEHVYYLKAKKFYFESEEEVPWTLDGEDGGLHSQGEICVHEKKVEIIVSKNYLDLVHPEETDLVELVE